VSSVQNLNRSIWQIVFELLSSSWNEDDIVLSPDGDERGLIFAEILLEFRVERDVGTVIFEETNLPKSKPEIPPLVYERCTNLNVGISRTLHQRIIKVPGFGLEFTGVGGSVFVLVEQA
jgi:hypothetical protein